jgi:hypothetical protein
MCYIGVQVAAIILTDSTRRRGALAAAWLPAAEALPADGAEAEPLGVVVEVLPAPAAPALGVVADAPASIRPVTCTCWFTCVRNSAALPSMMYDPPLADGVAGLAAAPAGAAPGAGLVAAPGVAAPGVDAPVEVVAFINMKRSAAADAAPAADPVELGVPVPVVPTAALLPWRQPVTLMVLAVFGACSRCVEGALV